MVSWKLTKTNIISCTYYRNYRFRTRPSSCYDLIANKLYHIRRCEKDKDTLEGTLRRCFSLKEFPVKDSKGQRIIISFKLLQADLKQVFENSMHYSRMQHESVMKFSQIQVREENPHLVFGNVGIARKMGFPEVILPGDVRNDLYLTLAYGEFSKGTKSSDKNIECAVTVCNEKGVPLQVI